MKKQLFILTLFLFITAVKLFSQEKNEMTTLPTVTVTSETIVNKEIDRAFKKAFPNSQLLDWYEVNKMYLIKFIKDEMKHHALFSQKGFLKYDISFGNEKNLSKDLLGKIQNAYEEYDITAVSNVKEGGRNIWVINLENPKHLVLARIENNELEETFKYNKN